jgi:hypothetical protein
LCAFTLIVKLGGKVSGGEPLKFCSLTPENFNWRLLIIPSLQVVDIGGEGLFED